MSLESIGEVIVGSLIANAAVWGVVWYVGKTLWRQKLAKELHKFTTQYSRLDQQRANAVMEIHGLICDIEQKVVWGSSAAATALVSTTPEERTMSALGQAWEGIVKLDDALGYRSLLLNEAIYERVNEWSKEMTALTHLLVEKLIPYEFRRQL